MARKSQMSKVVGEGKACTKPNGEYYPARAAQHNIAVCDETYGQLLELKDIEGRNLKTLLRMAVAMYRGQYGIHTLPGTVIAKHGPGGDFVKEVRA